LKTKNHLLSAFFVCLFVVCGFEHCIADMVYTFLAELQGLNISTTSISMLLGFSTLGNVIGGRIMVHMVKGNEEN
jgi:formate/nitrite transporter FocA (FNT family)